MPITAQDLAVASDDANRDKGRDCCAPRQYAADNFTLALEQVSPLAVALYAACTTEHQREAADIAVEALSEHVLTTELYDAIYDADLEPEDLFETVPGFVTLIERRNAARLAEARRRNAERARGVA